MTEEKIMLTPRRSLNIFFTSPARLGVGASLLFNVRVTSLGGLNFYTNKFTLRLDYFPLNHSLSETVQFD